MTDREREARDVLGEALWNGTDSTFFGRIVCRFTKLSGKPMVVLEDDRGLLHVYPENDRLITDPARLAEAGYRIVKFVKLDPEPFNPPPDTGG